MRLAEALAQRADMAKRLEQMKARLLRNAKTQEGEANSLSTFSPNSSA